MTKTKTGMVAVTATWQEWQDAARRAKMTIGRRPTLPVLAAAVIDTDEDGGTVRMRATNLENWTESILKGGMVTGEGPLLINARQLLDALRGIRGSLSPAAARCERITVMRHSAVSVTVSGFGRSLRLETTELLASDYPTRPGQPDIFMARFDAEDLVSAFGFAALACGKDDTLPMLTGVRLEVSKDLALFVGTDRYRLAIEELDLRRGSANEDMTALVPNEVLTLLMSLQGAVDVLSEGEYIMFRTPAYTVTTRLLDATFPAYRELIPRQDVVTWEIDRNALIGDVAAVAAVLDRGVAIKIQFEVDKIQVEGCEVHHAPGDGEAGSWLTSFNPQFLLAGLRALTSPTVTITATTQFKPHVLRGLRGNQRANYLIMPVRLP